MMRSIGSVIADSPAATLRSSDNAIVRQLLIRLLTGKGTPVSSNCRRRASSEEHTSELQSLMRSSYAVFCLKKTTTDHLTCNPNRTFDHHKNNSKTQENKAEHQ